MEHRLGLSGRRLVIGVAAMAALFALGLFLSREAFAKDGDVLKRVGCSGGSKAKLKLSHEDGGIEVEFEVDQNRSGVSWRVVMVRPGGGEIFAGRRTTRQPSGSFEVRRVTANRVGADTIRARAISPSGEVCRVRASISGTGTTDGGTSSGESTSGGGTTLGGTTSGGTTSGGDDSGSGGHGSDDGGTSGGDDHGSGGHGSDD
jgi:hypothetical protein